MGTARLHVTLLAAAVALTVTATAAVRAQCVAGERMLRKKPSQFANFALRRGFENTTFDAYPLVVAGVNGSADDALTSLAYFVFNHPELARAAAQGVATRAYVQLVPDAIGDSFESSNNQPSQLTVYHNNDAWWSPQPHTGADGATDGGGSTFTFASIGGATAPGAHALRIVSQAELAVDLAITIEIDAATGATPAVGGDAGAGADAGAGTGAGAGAGAAGAAGAGGGERRKRARAQSAFSYFVTADKPNADGGAYVAFAEGDVTLVMCVPGTHGSGGGGGEGGTVDGSVSGADHYALLDSATIAVILGLLLCCTCLPLIVFLIYVQRRRIKVEWVD